MSRPQYIAEISGNHGGDIKKAKALISIAAECGADWVKLQTFEPEQMCINPFITVPDGEWKGQPMQELYRKTHTPKAWHAELFAKAKACGIGIFSTPFHPDDVAFLETLNCPMYKVASFEANDHRLIRAIAETGKPIIISTGIVTPDEVEDTLMAYYDSFPGHPDDADITLLICASKYPAEPKDYNLSRIQSWREYFRSYSVNIGLSDHTLGSVIAAGATALGATMIEKHLCWVREFDTPTEDAKFSATPEQFHDMVETCNEIAAACNPRIMSAHDVPNRKLRRGLYFAKDVPEGAVITPDCLTTSRPCLGLGAERCDEVAGMLAERHIASGEPVLFDMLKR